MRMVNRSRRNTKLQAFTLVELLVVIAIIGVLVALLLPAIQAAREAARRNSCKNNLKQMALACLSHESSAQHLPTGGWGHNWVGDADRGNAGDQCGGWLYNVMPYIEEVALYNLPKDGAPNAILVAQTDGALKMQETARDFWNCPSRRSGRFAATTDGNAKNAKAGVSGFGSMVPSGSHDKPYTGIFMGRSDYAACAGTIGEAFEDGPGKLDAILDGTYQFKVKGALGAFNGERSPKIPAAEAAAKPRCDGVVFTLSQVRLRNIEDGTTGTYLVGEKNLRVLDYENGRGSGDEHSWCVGSSNNVGRLAGTVNDADGNAAGPNCAQDHPDIESDDFGSAHASSWHMSYCDGHVEALSYSIDYNIFLNGAKRADGNVNTEN